MNQCVRSQRHAARLHFIAHRFQPIDRILRLLSRMYPGRKIDVLAAIIHVADDEPGHRRDVRIPRPLGEIRVAVAACAHQSCVYVGRHIHDVVDRLGGSERRIGPRHREKLRHHQTNHQNNENPFKRFSHYRFACTLRRRLQPLPIVMHNLDRSNQIFWANAVCHSQRGSKTCPVCTVTDPTPPPHASCI